MHTHTHTTHKIVLLCQFLQETNIKIRLNVQKFIRENDCGKKKEEAWRAIILRCKSDLNTGRKKRWKSGCRHLYLLRCSKAILARLTGNLESKSFTKGFPSFPGTSLPWYSYHSQSLAWNGL